MKYNILILVWFSCTLFTKAQISGLNAKYYAGHSFKTLVKEKVDKEINFDFGFGAPYEGMPGAGFAIQWTGNINVPQNAEYIISLEGNSGWRLWINNTLYIGPAEKLRKGLMRV